jgi:polyhydroxyalkanoate synthesis regulator phasin
MEAFMGEKKDDPFNLEAMVGAWTDAMQTFWGGLSAMAPPAPPPDKPPSETGKRASTSASMDALGRMAKGWQTMATAMSAPESVNALLKGAGAMPEVLSQLAQSTLSSFMELQQKAAESAGRIGASVEAYQFENIDENIFRVWTDIYEKEFRQFFKIPQLGLTRNYQEKVNAAMDAFNRHQSTMAEFLRLLALPFNRSLAVMQDKMGELAEKGELPDDSQVYYRNWVKVLEGHFMTLFQTPEYVQTLAKTIDSLSEFSQARDAVIEDMLKSLPIAGRTEVDELAQEVYRLKRRIRRLEQAQSRSNPSTAASAFSGDPTPGGEP